MAVTKKTASVSEEIKKTEIKTTSKTQKKFAPDEVIECRSVTVGQLVGTGKKSQIYYLWSNYGDVQYVEYQDLLAWKSSRSGYVYNPQFIIENDELLEQWPDVKAVNDKVKSADCNKIFNQTAQQFKISLTKVPESYKFVVVNMARAKIESGELDSVAKIKALDKAFGTDLISHVSN